MDKEIIFGSIKNYLENLKIKFIEINENKIDHIELSDDLTKGVAIYVNDEHIMFDSVDINDITTTFSGFLNFQFKNTEIDYIW